MIVLTLQMQNVCFEVCWFFITDVNECNNTTYPPCHADATCNNTIGSYLCDCDEGYGGNGINCTGMYLIYDIMFVSKPHTTVEMTRKISKRLLRVIV